MDKKTFPAWRDSYIDNTLAKRLFIGLATCFFIISTILAICCTGTKIRARKVFVRVSPSIQDMIQRKHEIQVFSCCADNKKSKTNVFSKWVRSHEGLSKKQMVC